MRCPCYPALFLFSRPPSVPLCKPCDQRLSSAPFLLPGTSGEVRRKDLARMRLSVQGLYLNSNLCQEPQSGLVMVKNGVLVGRRPSVSHGPSRRPAPPTPTPCNGPPYGRTFGVLRSGVRRVTHGGSPTRWSSRSPRYREVRQLRDRGRHRPMRPVLQPSLFGSSEGDLRVLPRHRQTNGRQGQIGRVFLPLVLFQRGRDVFRCVSYVIHPHLGHRRSS